MEVIYDLDNRSSVDWFGQKLEWREMKSKCYFWLKMADGPQ